MVICFLNNCLIYCWFLCNLSCLIVCKLIGLLEFLRKFVIVGFFYVLCEVVVVVVIIFIVGYEVIEVFVVDIILFKEYLFG